MYTIKVAASFDAAHFLSNYQGKCANIHGHRWKIEVFVETEQLVPTGQTKGMITDFSVLKEDLNEILEEYDHSFIFEEGSLQQQTLECLVKDGFKLVAVNFRTTAENFSNKIYHSMKEKGHRVKCVTVYETPNNSATYQE